MLAETLVFGGSFGFWLCLWRCVALGLALEVVILGVELGLLGCDLLLEASKILLVLVVHDARSSASVLLGVVLANLPEPRVAVLDLDFLAGVDLVDEGLGLGCSCNRGKVNEGNVEELTGFAVFTLDEVDVVDARITARRSPEDLAEHLLDVPLVKADVHARDAERRDLNGSGSHGCCRKRMRSCKRK